MENRCSFLPRAARVLHGPLPPRPASITRRGWDMHRSSWDLEVHARQMQQRRLREANRARQLDAARRGNTRYQPSWFSISRFVSLAQAWLSPRRTLEEDAMFGVEAQAPAQAALPPLPAGEPRWKPLARSSRLSQPYADMTVLARGPVALPAERPCGVGDC